MNRISTVRASATGRYARRLLALGAVLLLAGCANTASMDPLEPMNRKFYAANEVLDKYAVKPVVNTYVKITPSLIRAAIANFFDNIGDIFSGLNGVLQGKPVKAGADFSRFVINSTLGMAGFVDIASKMGIQSGNEDLGQTLGYWGLGQGPYLFLPLLGPTTFRDGTGLGVQLYVDPLDYVFEDTGVRNGVTALRLVDARADADDVLNVVDRAALDRYRFIRSAYLQRRLYLVHDGHPPDDSEE